MSLMDRIFNKIITAEVYQVAKKTPLDWAEKTSKEFGNQILMKREDLQETFSFKIRGAFNAINSLPPEQQKKGFICCSAGNHAQGVATAAGRLGIKAHIVMPVVTPEIKIEAVRDLGGIIYSEGENFIETQAVAYRIAAEKDLTFIHPFDNEEVIAGQGTIGMEMHQDAEKIDYVFVPIGGGGLISGIAVYLKKVRPEVKIIGVEPESSNSMYCAVQVGKPVRLKQVGTFAEGVAVPQVGEIPFQICKDLLDDIILISTDEICAAIRRIYYEKRVIVEPAGAISMAGAIRYLQKRMLKNKTLITINCGANMNFDLLRYVSQNSKVGADKEALFAIKLSEKPGTLKKICRNVIKDRSIVEFNYRYSGKDSAQVFIGLEVKNRTERFAIKEQFEKNRYEIIDLTENEIAKDHIRNMIGGKLPQSDSERIFRVIFPERPNALYEFLNSMEICWNISLFNYLNNGSSYSRVLIGIQTPENEQEKLNYFVNNSSNYTFEEKTDDISHQIFL